MVVARACHAKAEQILIIVHSLDDRGEEEQELRVVFGSASGIEQIFALVRAHGPVVVLAASVHAGKRLFVQKACHAVARRHFLHGFHSQLVVVGGYVGGGEYGRKFVLGGSNFVVLGLGEYTQLPQLAVKVLHELAYARFDRTEVVVLKLLTLGRGRTHDSPARVD